MEDGPSTHGSTKRGKRQPKPSVKAVAVLEDSREKDQQKKARKWTAVSESRSIKVVRELAWIFSLSDLTLLGVLSKGLLQLENLVSHVLVGLSRSCRERSAQSGI